MTMEDQMQQLQGCHSREHSRQGIHKTGANDKVLKEHDDKEQYMTD